MVIEALSEVGADQGVIDNAVDAIFTTPTSTTDYLARKIIVLIAAGEEPNANFLDSLAALQNADGGWGFAKGYGSSILETALALKALRNAAYGGSVFSAGVNYLKLSQNADGGWH